MQKENDGEKKPDSLAVNLYYPSESSGPSIKKPLTADLINLLGAFMQVSREYHK